MNISLLDPFVALNEYPETLTNALSFGYSVFVKYNNQGNYLASGLSTGTILIIDNDTKNVYRELKRHNRPIQSICWSKCGRYLLSSSRDWKTLVWDLKTGDIIRSFNFNGPIWHSEFNPVNHRELIVALFDAPPVLVDSDDNVHAIQEDNVPVVKFHPSGKFIFTGSSKGLLKIIQREGLESKREEKISNSTIKNITLSKNGKKLALNSSDRILRQIALPDIETETDPSTWDLEVEHKYQDIVNRLQWNSICFNDNGEYLIASAFGSAHVIYIWETEMGSLLKILEGSNEELVDIEWNTTKCTICATGMDSGSIFVWSLVVPQKWSSLAPDFVETEENIDYEEKEDEFDIVPEDELNMKQLNEEDEVIDAQTFDRIDARGNELATGFIIPMDYSFEVTERFE